MRKSATAPPSGVRRAAASRVSPAASCASNPMRAAGSYMRARTGSARELSTASARRSAVSHNPNTRLPLRSARSMQRLLGGYPLSASRLHSCHSEPAFAGPNERTAYTPVHSTSRCLLVTGDEERVTVRQECHVLHIHSCSAPIHVARIELAAADVEHAYHSVHRVHEVQLLCRVSCRHSRELMYTFFSLMETVGGNSSLQQEFARRCGGKTRTCRGSVAYASNVQSLKSQFKQKFLEIKLIFRFHGAT